MKLELGAHELTVDQIAKVISDGATLGLSPQAREAIIQCRNYLENKLKSSDELFYGINTGFGALCRKAISEKEIEKLQENLILSHAVGMGRELSPEISRIILLLKIQNFCFGHSGVSIELVDRLIDIYNAGISPVIYELGSLGASGDLAPLSHLSLMLLGKGEVVHKGFRTTAEQALKDAGIEPFVLKSKEGLALINGTQFSSGISVWLMAESIRLIQKASLTAAISLEAFNCAIMPFSPLIQSLRKHDGQEVIAHQILTILEGSDLFTREYTFVQDPYSFRCIPQVHGASLDILENALFAVENEINSVTDNPLIFPIHDKILSGGNFHAQPIAIHLDALAIALSELGNIAERRIFQLLNGHRELPPMLVENAGLNSGLMITQYTAASIVSQNKQYCTPASADSITSSAGQEDHVSMASNAATKAIRVLENVKRILAIELLVGLQALEFRKERTLSPQLMAVKDEFRNHVDVLTDDRLLKHDMDIALEFLEQLNIV